MLELSQIKSFYPEFLRPYGRNLLREYLQYKILEMIFSSKFAGKLFFMGGTAIHIVHALPRFSEDLDFDNRGLTQKDFRELAELITKKLMREGYKTELKFSLEGSTYHVYFKIPGILYENNLSGHKRERLTIKLGTEPQKFRYTPDKFILNKFDVFTRINVVPADILLSQKVYAILNRKRPVGRDFYDFLYLAGKAKPDFGYLKSKIGINNFKIMQKALLKRCKSLNFNNLAKEISPFLFFSEDAKKIISFQEYVKLWKTSG